MLLRRISSVGAAEALRCLKTGLKHNKKAYNITGFCAGHKRFASNSSNKKTQETFNEPGGYLFNRVPGVKYEPDWQLRIYIVFYLGGMGLFMFLWQYKPDCDPQEWARREALKRIAERGINLEDYDYKPPTLYDDPLPE